ncbi:MAG TPA: protein translocase subunit SecD [Cellvibrionaceae bacterium]|nr:protein translocase subunit SecD [Cellvibrionaceae bacterium]HMW72984.1 protein translocase subunit SecD [Cellvibrionaceae bacterium]HMY39058.1 protein translocase subunit SecD [Marinagarivorans sp.]
MKPYPLWKYLALIAATVLGAIYSLPNLYLPDPAVQVSGYSSRIKVDQVISDKAVESLKAANITVLHAEMGKEGVMIRLTKAEDQLVAQDVLDKALNDQSGKKGADYVIALNKASTTPAWLEKLGAKPLNLGLDLAGGIHFVLEVDTPKSVNDRMLDIEEVVKKAIRDARIFDVDLKHSGTEFILGVKDEAARDSVTKILQESARELQHTTTGDAATGFIIKATLTEVAIREIEEHAISQNLTTLRNRVNELGVAEPIVQRQGRNRIVVELPGLQDPARAKAIIGKTANLEFRLEANATSTSKEKFDFRNEADQARFGGAVLERRPIVTGEAVVGATRGYDQQTGQVQVNISLSGDGGAEMHRATRNNVGRKLGVVFIEYRTSKSMVRNDKGELVEQTVQIPERHCISLATIQSALGREFRTTGLTEDEAGELALLLRAGSLAAPMKFVEERVIGPSLGAENIKKGLDSSIWGFIAVGIFMILGYKVFGLTANIALCINLVMLLAIMAVMGATLTLPGIGGIVLTMGIAVDANVLIFARIKEELEAGLQPHAAIVAGFDRAFITILDSHLTTMLVAAILFAIGTGPIKGFAATLFVGISTSLFSAIVGSRSMVNLIYGRRNVTKLHI